MEGDNQKKTKNSLPTLGIYDFYEASFKLLYQKY
jgi:hypothetical protein